MTRSCFAALALLLATPALAQQNAYTVPSTVHGSIRSDGAVNADGNAEGERRVGTSANANIGLTNYYLFQLPAPSVLTGGQGEASIEFTFTSRAGSGATPTFSGDMYGLGWISGAAPPASATIASWYYGDMPVDTRTRNSLGLGSPASGNVSLLVDNFLKPALVEMAPGRIETGPNAALKTFIQSLYADGAQAGHYAVIQLAADQKVQDNNIVPVNRGFEVGVVHATRPYQVANLNIGSLPVAADSFGTSRNRINASLNGDESSGYGFTGGWVASTLPLGDAFLRQTAPTPLAFTSTLGSYDGGPTGAEILGSNGVVNNPLRRELAAPMSGDVYFRAMVRADIGADSDDMLAVWLGNSAGGDADDRTGGSAFLGFRGDQFLGSINNTTEVNTAGFTAGTTHLLVGRLFNASPGDGYNRLEFWMDPAAGDAPDGTVVLAGANGGFTSVTHVGFFTGAATENTDLYFVDALALGSSFLDVLGVNSIAGNTPHAGDFDSDGDVDGADFVAWQTNFPKPDGATLAQGDADGDGDVDGADFVVWQTNFPFSPAPGAASVPESPSLLLALLGGLTLVSGAKLSRGGLN
jgi:hypothetical protein